MRVSVLQENLARGLNIVNRAVPTKPMMTILSNVMVETTEDQRLRLVGTTSEFSIATWIGASIDTPGATTIPGKNFYDLVSNLSPERVDLDLDQRTQTLQVKCGGNEGRIRCIAPDEFPTVPMAPSEGGVTLPAEVFVEMIQHIGFAAAKDDNRPVLMGILAKFEGSTLTLASADGYRLGIRMTELEIPVEEKIEVIIPARSMIEVARIVGLGEKVETVTIYLPENRHLVIFDLGSIQVTAALIDGNFPDYEAILPKQSDTISQVYTKDLLRACKRSEVFAKDSGDAALLNIRPSANGPGEIIISSRSQELGENIGTLDASIDGDAIEISFNIKYLIDVLNIIREDQVYLQTSGLSSPGVVKPVGRDDFLHIIMPMSSSR